MGTVSEVLSVIFAGLGFVFLALALVLHELHWVVPCSLLLGLHMLAIALAIPFIIRAMYILDNLSPGFSLLLIGICLINCLILLRMYVQAQLDLVLVQLGITIEIIPILLISFSLYIQSLEDYETGSFQNLITYPF